MAAPGRGQWAQWLLHRRRGGDPEAPRRARDPAPVRGRVLDNAKAAAGETVPDIGCGDGLLASGAPERVGETGAIIFSDISQDLLDHARILAEQMGALDRCRFVLASAGVSALEAATHAASRQHAARCGTAISFTRHPMPASPRLPWAPVEPR